MSPSLAVDPRGHGGPDGRAALSWLDVAAAIALHLALLAALLAAGLWRGTPEFHPQTVTVRIVQAPSPHHRPHHPVRHRARPRPRKAQPHPRPTMSRKIAPQKTALKKATPRKAAPKPVPARAPVKAQRPASEPFDPFKPLESPSDVAPDTETAAASRDARELVRAQLSRQEINRYIARIQSAVQRHWKVPALTRHERDPLVLMRLNPDGSVAEVRVLESSGSPALDASLKRAILAAAPFEVPPREQFEVFRENKIRFHPLR